MATTELAQTDARVCDMLTWGAVHLRGAGLDNPRLEAEILLSHVLSWDRTKLVVHDDSPVPPECLARYREWIEQRRGGYPIAYLTGTREFYSRLFAVAPGVLIPRPETELLVETVVGRLGARPGTSLILDVGTGCGNVAVTLAAELAGASLFAVDISPDALDIARRNAHLHRVQDRIVFLEGDLFAPLDDLDVAFDWIVSNPPYIGTDELGAVERGVIDHEPHSALLAGADGLDVIRSIVEESPAFLRPGGFLSMEVGYLQAVKVRRLMEERGFINVTTARDLARHCRVISGEWR